MGQPAARVGDEHTCLMSDPVTGAPHVGGVITGPGCATVLIEGKPAARVGDECTCTGGSGGQPNYILSGSTGVYIGGKLAARVGDVCMHGGRVSSGSSTVLIGEGKGGLFSELVSAWDHNGNPDEPSKEEKIRIVKKVISDCIALLEERLPLLVQEDPDTLESFEKWFGPFTGERKAVIVERMEKQLEFFKSLTLDGFKRISNEEEYRTLPAQVYRKNSDDICLGNLFWNNRSLNKSRVTVLIHEVSHLKKVGGTKDKGYDWECEKMAKTSPHKALYNADSYAFFITGYQKSDSYGKELNRS